MKEYLVVSVNSVQGELDEASSKVTEVRQKAERVAMLSGQLELDDKLMKIRKNIELARGRADVVGNIVPYSVYIPGILLSIFGVYMQ